MTGLSARWYGVAAIASAVVAAAALPPAAGATPVYQSGASAGWAWQEGDVLTANPGTWTSSTGISYTYAWFDENSKPLGAGATYTVTGRDVGHQIYAAITAADGTPPSLTVNTPTVGPMHYRPPVNVERPSVSGTFATGSTLVATPGTWVSGGASTAPIQIAYSWYRGCTTGPRPDCTNAGTVGGASSLVLSSADVGRWISLSVTASYPDGAGGTAGNSVWLGNLGLVVGSSIRAGDTVSGVVQWAVTVPGGQTIAISVNGAQAAVLPADDAGAATFALDTRTVPNGVAGLAVTVTWKDGAVTTTQLGSVTVANPVPPPPPPLGPKPVIAAPVATPSRATAGKRFVVTFAVVRSDTRRPLTSGTMTCDPSVAGRRIAHGEVFAAGKARLTVTVPRWARHKRLEVRLTIRLGERSTTRVAAFRVG